MGRVRRLVRGARPRSGLIRARRERDESLELRCNVCPFGHDVRDMCCVRCEKNESLVPRGFCADCLSAVHVEVEFGWFRFQEYLSRWAEFARWCEARGLATV